MIRTALLTTVVALVLTFGARAQQPQAAEPAKPTDLPAAQPQQARNAPQLVNIRVELALTEEGPGAAPAKTVSILIADQQQGRVRSSGPGAALNVDVRPEMVRDGRIGVHLVLEYRPDSNATTMSQSLWALLESGKPLLVSQSADPKGDRRVKAELTATILK